MALYSFQHQKRGKRFHWCQMPQMRYLIDRDFISSYLLVKTEIDEIISQGIKKPSCSDLLPDANNSMVEVGKPSTLFKVAQGPNGRYFVSVKRPHLLNSFPSRSASRVSLNTGSNRNQEQKKLHSSTMILKGLRSSTMLMTCKVNPLLTLMLSDVPSKRL